MTKLKRPARGIGARAAMPAKVQPPQHQHTSNIKIVGVAESEDAARFLKVAVGEKTALLNVDNLADPRSGELKILTRLGEPLLKPAARTEFLRPGSRRRARSSRASWSPLKTGLLRGEYSCSPTGP